MITSNSLQAAADQQKWETLPVGAENLHEGALLAQGGTSPCPSSSAWASLVMLTLQAAGRETSLQDWAGVGLC